MKREWFSAEEIAAALSDELPETVQGINKRAAREGWRSDAHRCRKAPSTGSGQVPRGRPRRQYHISLLPHAAQMRLVLMHGDSAPAGGAREELSTALWQRFERLAKSGKDECARRLDVLQQVESYRQSGLSETAAIGAAAHEAKISPATLWNWRAQIAGLARVDWLAGLAPQYRSAPDRAECHPEAWEALTADWLRPGAPAFSACYRRMRRVAGAYGWSPVPPERTLRRRIEREIPAAVRALARKGKDKAKTLYPAQRRTRAGLRAMQAVNTDGHRIDVFVRLPNARQPVRMHLLAIQDLYSGKIVAWRLAESENRVAVRLAIGDMVEAFGIPETVVFDNGRAFASKWITGGFPNRYRFKVRDEEPQGLVKSLGVTDIRWTTPYSGQSKPIERAFRDLAEEIAKHPCCDGAYVGNRPDAKPENYGTRAIPIDEFSEHVARTIGEHNARPGRDTETARGRSFDETFNESFAQAIVRWPTEAQRSLWLLAAERVSAQRVIAGARGSGTVPGAQVRPLDLDNLDSVRTFAGGDFGDGIDALVLNAGLQGYDLKAKTTQGFERTFGVNHLAHYLLLRLLLPQVKDGGIIVITSSGTHDPDEKTGVPPPRHAVTEMLAYPDRDPDVLESPMRAGRQAYSASKLCNLMTARTLAASPEAKARNLHVYAYDPGFTPGTSLARQSPWFVRAIWPLLPLFRPFMKGMNSLEAAGRGLLGIADGSITREGGVYCSLRGAKPTWPPPSEIARDKTACEKLWRDSAKMVGLPA